MAFVSFLPAGSQIDRDSIQDIQLNVGDKIAVSFDLDTTGLSANLQSFDIRVDQDIVEIDLQAVRTEADIAAFPNLTFGGSPQGDDIFSAVFERNGPPGAVPDTIKVIVEGEVTALPELRNDGKPDLGITVVKAIDVNGKDVTDLFEPLSQAVDIQPFPVVSVSVDKTLPLSEANEDSGTFIINLNEPAPVGGLLVNFDAVDSDGIPGDVAASTVNGAIQVNENGSPSGILIDEGVTEARITLTAVPDDIVEGEEISGLDLLPGDGYAIDPESNSASFIVTDLPIVTFSVDRTVISEGEEKPQIFTLQLNEPAPDDGLTVKLQLEDPDGDLGDGGFPPELFNNIDESNFVVENGNFVLEFTISPGATEATFSFLSGEDNKIEGDETFTLTLLDDESYSIDSASVGIVTTLTEKEVINGTSAGEKLFGTDASQFIIGFAGNDTIFGNGGEDNLIGDEGDDLIYGGSQADTILGGEGNDTIFANGGGDLINSGTGEDIVWLGDGKATVILETGEGFDIVNNFQLGATTFQVETTDNLSFTDSVDGAKIFQGDDLLAVVSSQFANTFSDNLDSIFMA
ncbi:MAG: calcium-binding protein [Cyanobacteria bacterium J06635_10]